MTGDQIATRLFPAVLLRAAGSDELDMLGEVLDEGLMTPAQLVVSGWQTVEFAQTALPLFLIHETLYGEAPDPDTLLGWRGMVDSGQTLQQVAGVMIAGSAHGVRAAASYDAGDVQDFAVGLMGAELDASLASAIAASVNDGTLTLADMLVAGALQAPPALAVRAGLAMLQGMLSETAVGTGEVAGDAPLADVQAVLDDYLEPRIVFPDGVVLYESDANDGSIAASLTVQLVGAEFNGVVGRALGAVSGLPAGLTGRMILADSKHATLTIAGNATSHDATDSASAVTLTFNDVNFRNGIDAADVFDSTYAEIAILFNNGGRWSETEGELTLDGSAEGDVLVDLSTEKFSVDGVSEVLRAGDLSAVVRVDAEELTGGGLVFVGAAADETVIGSDGDDDLDGGDGLDMLYGGVGDDRLTGGYDIDVLSGGAGSDTFVFDAWANGLDGIVDFMPGTGGDVLDFLPFLTSGVAPAASLEFGPGNSASVVLATSAAEQAWTNAAILFVADNGVGIADAADVAALFGAGKPFAAPTAESKLVVLTAGVPATPSEISGTYVWFVSNGTNVTSIEAAEVEAVALLVGINNTTLNYFVPENFVLG